MFPHVPHACIHRGAHVHIAHILDLRLRVLVYSMHRHVGGIYTHILCVYCRVTCGCPTVGTCVAQGSEHTLCLSLVSLPSHLRHSHLPVCLRGIGRSSWVNAAYAPGGSKAVLERAPLCGADPRQVPSLPERAPALHHPPQHGLLPPSWLLPTNLGGLPGGGGNPPPPPAFVWGCGI